VAHAVNEWFTTVDHKRIGDAVYRLPLVFLLIAGLGSRRDAHPVGRAQQSLRLAQVFNRMYHARTTMVFFWACDSLWLGNYLIPRCRRARHAFPRLNAFSFWTPPSGGLLLYFRLHWRRWFVLGAGTARMWCLLMRRSQQALLARSQHRHWILGVFPERHRHSVGARG